MPRTRLMVIAVGVALTAMVSQAHARETVVSAYSALSGAACKVLSRDREASAVTRRCRGVHGYNLLRYDFDARASVSVVGPDKQVRHLRLPDVISNGPTTLGTTAEWRVARRRGKPVPVALVVRLHSADPAAPGSWLAVARLDGERTCVTHRFADNAAAKAAGKGAAANALARRASLDKRRACLAPL